MSTKRQHRKNKKKNLEDKTTYPSLCNEKPIESNQEEAEKAHEIWRLNFLSEVRADIKNRDKV